MLTDGADCPPSSDVNRDTGESYEDFLMQLAQASGIETPTREDWRGSISDSTV